MDNSQLMIEFPENISVVEQIPCVLFPTEEKDTTEALTLDPAKTHTYCYWCGSTDHPEASERKLCPNCQQGFIYIVSEAQFVVIDNPMPLHSNPLRDMTPDELTVEELKRTEVYDKSRAAYKTDPTPENREIMMKAGKELQTLFDLLG